MNDAITYIVESLVSLAIVLIMRYFVPWIKAQVEASKYKWLVDIIDKAVLAAEQTITDPKTGHIRKEKVTEIADNAIKQRKINIDPEIVDAIIESAVFTMNKQIDDKKKAEA